MAYEKDENEQYESHEPCPMRNEKDTDPSNPCDYKVGDRIVLRKPQKRGKDFGTI